jgi:hypothetical protein
VRRVARVGKKQNDKEGHERKQKRENNKAESSNGALIG